MHRYDLVFFDYTNEGAVRSAGVVVDLLNSVLRPGSVVDFGSGEGAWLSVWRSAGVTDCVGVDGSYVDAHRLLIPREHFQAADLGKSADLGRRFDLVQSLEVGEHLPEGAAETFVETLTRHGNIILFSAAVPGQGGENHVNEQPYDYWRQLFEKRGFRVFDWLRPRLAARKDVEPWYRYNLMLYVHDSQVSALPETIRSAEVFRGAPIPDRSPLLYKLRKSVIRCLPHSAMTWLAMLKKHFIVRSRVAAKTRGH